MGSHGSRFREAHWIRGFHFSGITFKLSQLVLQPKNSSGVGLSRHFWRIGGPGNGEFWSLSSSEVAEKLLLFLVGNGMWKCVKLGDCTKLRWVWKVRFVFFVEICWKKLKALLLEGFLKKILWMGSFELWMENGNLSHSITASETWTLFWVIFVLEL